MEALRKNIRAISIIAIVLGPALLLAIPSVQRAFADSLRGPRNPAEIATTLAFKDGKVVTVQYSNIYFCNSSGPATTSSSSPCTIFQLEAFRGFWVTVRQRSCCTYQSIT